jgi:hypothetical protein
MTTLTQSELEDIRRTQAIRKEHAKQSSMDYAEGVQCLIDCDALLDHIAQLTAERDEAIADNDDCHFEIAGKDTRIAALEAQPSAQPRVTIGTQLAFSLLQRLVANDIRNAEKAISLLRDEATQPSAQFVAGMRVLKDIVRLQKDIQADVSTAHRLRGSGASEWMRDDDRDMRRELDAAFSAARAILAEAALKGEGK